MTAKSLRHKFQSTVPDDADTSLVRPSNWNDDHDLWGGFRTITAAADLITAADHLSLLSYNNATGIAVTMPPSLPLGWKCKLLNIGAGAVTLTPGTTINGSNAPFRLLRGAALELFGTGTTDHRAIHVSLDDGVY